MNRYVSNCSRNRANTDRSQLVALGMEQLEDVYGLHFTFLDPRKSNNTRALVKQAKEIVKLFEAEGYGKGGIVFSVSAASISVFRSLWSLLTSIRYLLQKRAFKPP